MNKRYDLIVVGARCAGAATAMLMAKKGYKVLLLDKAEFPSDTISTHIIFPPGVELLHRWGVLDDVLDTGCPRMYEMSFHPGPMRLTGSPPPINGVSGIICPRRYLLDQVLADHAVRAGVEFRDHCHVEEILTEEDTVTGVRCRSRGGTSVTEYASHVIGADGRNSLVAKTMKAPRYEEQPSYSCWYYTYFSGVPVHHLSLFLLGNHAMAIIPTNNNQVCIAQNWQASAFKEIRSNIEESYMRSFKAHPFLSEVMQNAKQEEKFYGMTDLPNFFAKPYGKGWALVGDAGYHKDPIAGQGIMDAYITAQMLSDALDAGFSGKMPMEEALSHYENQRNEEMMPKYHFACDMAKLEPPPPEMIGLFQAMQGNQDAINRFLGAIAGTVKIPEFFSPENIASIVSAKAVKS